MEAIVLYPSPGVGHLISMVEFGKLLLKHKPSLCIHILNFTAPFNTGSTAPYIEKISATTPIIFHHLPTITLPPSTTNCSRHHEILMFELLRLNNPYVHQVLLSISNNYTISAFIADFFCYSAHSVTAKLNLPTYVFFASGASCLSVFLYFPSIHKNTTKSLKDMIGSLLEVPGVPPIPATNMVKLLLERDDKVYEYFLNCIIQCPKSAGVIVNTFESIEPRALKAISEGLCVQEGPTPPVSCIGPLIAVDDCRGSTVGGDSDSVPECLTWLDSQPSQSVVVLCFGSLGLFSEEQLTEIASGLERSGQRFLWVVRNPPSKGETLAISAQPEPDLDVLLPEGFLDRTKEIGLVVKSWVPQVAVLSHDAVGGFVTHCGWNSVLEAVCAGVPMVAWPLYAEQRMNRIFLVEEMKIALPMIESENGFVSSAEVEKRIRELMESEEGKCIRKRTTAMQNESKTALTEGGSSRVALSKLVQSWNRK